MAFAAFPVRPARRGGTDAGTHGRTVSPTRAAALAPSYTRSGVSLVEMLRALSVIRRDIHRPGEDGGAGRQLRWVNFRPAENKGGIGFALSPRTEACLRTALIA